MRKLLRIVALLAVILFAAFFAVRQYTKSFSPASVAESHTEGLDIKITYSKPGKKNRFIFGREQDKALVPYGKVWRTGANEATIIEIDQAVVFAGVPLKAGKYSLWTVPGQAKWEVILNSETGQWGTEYNDGKNILSAMATLRIIPHVQELFKISFENQPAGVNMILSWDQTEAVVPITKL